MGLLTGKRLLITGISSNRSIAYGVAKACHREGAELAFTYNNERFKERVESFAAEMGSNIVIKLDVASDEIIEQAVATLGSHWDKFDGLVHSIAWAPKEAIAGDFLDGLNREGFLAAMNISAYSFPALAKAFLPLMEGRKASILTLSFLGGERVVPNYNTMGMAKAALETSVRYLSASLGAKGIRANALSTGPVKTLAASGIKDFGRLLSMCEGAAPLGRSVTAEEIGNMAAFVLSDYASGVTGDIIYVDAGFHNMALANEN